MSGNIRTFNQHFLRDEASIVLAPGRRRKRRKGTSCCKFLIHSMSILSYLRTDLAVVDVDVMANESLCNDVATVEMLGSCCRRSKASYLYYIRNRVLSFSLPSHWFCSSCGVPEAGAMALSWCTQYRLYRSVLSPSNWTRRLECTISSSCFMIESSLGHWCTTGIAIARYRRCYLDEVEHGGTIEAPS